MISATVPLPPARRDPDNWPGDQETRTELTAWDDGESLLKPDGGHYMDLQCKQCPTHKTDMNGIVTKTTVLFYKLLVMGRFKKVKYIQYYCMELVKIFLPKTLIYER